MQELPRHVAIACFFTLNANRYKPIIIHLCQSQSPKPGSFGWSWVAQVSHGHLHTSGCKLHAIANLDACPNRHIKTGNPKDRRNCHSWWRNHCVASSFNSWACPLPHLHSLLWIGRKVFEQHIGKWFYVILLQLFCQCVPDLWLTIPQKRGKPTWKIEPCIWDQNIKNI